VSRLGALTAGVVEQDMRVRFDKMRWMGIRAVMIAGENPLTARAIPDADLAKCRRSGGEDSDREGPARQPPETANTHSLIVQRRYGGCLQRSRDLYNILAGQLFGTCRSAPMVRHRSRRYGSCRSADADFYPRPPARLQQAGMPVSRFPTLCALCRAVSAVPP